MKLLRPLLTLLLLFVLLVLVIGSATSVPGDENVSTSMGQLVEAAAPVWLPLALIGFLAGLHCGGSAGLRASVGFLFGREDVGRALCVQRTLAGASRAMVSGGLFLSLLAATCLYLIVTAVLQGGEGVDPRGAARLVTWTLMPAVFALGVGRVLCGVAADRAAVLAGQPGRRAYSGRDDLLLLLFLLPPALSMFALFVKADTL